MNFYPHHIGDYLTATAHLSWMEDCAYRRLLDLYYSREQAIPGDVVQAARLCRATTKDERKAVETVLAEFFTLTERGWTHARCEEEIVKAAEAAERARQNGKRGGRPPKEKPTENPEKTQSVFDGNPEESNSKAPNPITNTNTSEANASGGEPPTNKDLMFFLGVPLLTAAGVSERNARSMLGGLAKAHGEAAVVQVLNDCAASRPVEPVSWIQASLRTTSAGKPKSYAQQAADIARTTVPAKPGRDPTLVRLEQEALAATKPPPEIRERMAQLTRGSA